MSNKDRIARAAEEARLAEEEKLAKKTSKKATKKATKRTSKRAKDVRMKIVWVVCNASGKPVKTFSYPDKAAAESEAQRLSSSTGYPHELRASKVPMD